jgi:uncharacterized protein (DUF1330 family)
MMVTRISPRRVAQLARRDVPAPVDVINLIELTRFDRYQWYGLFVLPVMRAAGARVLWMARHQELVAGQQQCEKLLIVRYPSHRRFMAMTLNPYYVAINRLREAGVRRFEAAFTHASHSMPGLERQSRLLGVHFRGEIGAVVAALAGSGSELVYATSETAPIGFMHPLRPTDPNPLTFKQFALFTLPEGDPRDAVGAVAAVADEFSMQVYARESASTYAPPLVQRLTAGRR